MEPAESTIDQWLVRTSNHEIRGPFTKDAIIRQIREGLLSVDDEVCQANRFWFYLDERDEVSQQLGVEVPQKATFDEEEITDTETQTLTKELNPASGGAPSAQDVELPELMEVGGGENSAVLGNRALREFQGKKASAQRSSQLAPSAKPMVVGRVERPSVWRWIAIVLILTVIGLVGFLIYVLQWRG